MQVSAATSPNLVDACKALKKRMQEQYGATFQVVAASRSSVGCPSHIVDGFLELNVQRLRFNARKYLKQHPHLADDDALACDTGAADDADGGSGAGGEKDPPDMKVFVFKSLPFLTLTAGLKQRDSWWNKVRIALWVCAGMALAAYLYVSTFCSTLCLGAQPPLADTTDDAAEFDDADGVLRCPQEDIGASETCRWKIRCVVGFAGVATARTASCSRGVVHHAGCCFTLRWPCLPSTPLCASYGASTTKPPATLSRGPSCRCCGPPPTMEQGHEMCVWVLGGGRRHRWEIDTNTQREITQRKRRGKREKRERKHIQSETEKRE